MFSEPVVFVLSAYDWEGICNGGHPLPDCGGSCDNENVYLLGECYNIETTTIKLRTKKYLKPLKKEIGDLIYYEFSSCSKVLFHFKDGTISVDVDNVNKESLMKTLEKI